MLECPYRTQNQLSLPQWIRQSRSVQSCPGHKFWICVHITGFVGLFVTWRVQSKSYRIALYLAFQSGILSTITRDSLFTGNAYLFLCLFYLFIFLLEQLVMLLNRPPKHEACRRGRKKLGIMWGTHSHSGCSACLRLQSRIFRSSTKRSSHWAILIPLGPFTVMVNLLG